MAYLAGYVALYLGDAASARAELAKANQEDPFVLMLEAEAAEKAGDKAAATRYWQEILKINGHGLQHALSRPTATQKVEGGKSVGRCTTHRPTDPRLQTQTYDPLVTSPSAPRPVLFRRPPSTAARRRRRRTR